MAKSLPDREKVVFFGKGSSVTVSFGTMKRLVLSPHQLLDKQYFVEEVLGENLSARGPVVIRIVAGPMPLEQATSWIDGYNAGLQSVNRGPVIEVDGSGYARL